MLPQPLTPRGEGASSYSSSSKEHMNFVMFEVLAGRTQHISPVLWSINLLVCARRTPHLHTANKEDRRGERAQGCIWVKKVTSNANLPVQRVLLTISDAIIF